MRVIAGSAKSLPLKCVPGMTVRPTTDRIKETLFNMLMPHLPGCRFLDLFAGSGAIGIEALSRGAACCVFVEKSAKAAECIKQNLAFTHLSDRARLVISDVSAALGSVLAAEPPFDLIFLDPPYNMNLEKAVLSSLASSALVAENTIIIVECSNDTDFSYVEDLGFDILRKKKYKTNTHLMLGKVDEKKERGVSL